MRRRAAFVLGLSLAVLPLPTGNPMGDDALTELKPAGVPARMLRHSNDADRVR
jgi:hypothetical protein